MRNVRATAGGDATRFEITLLDGQGRAAQKGVTVTENLSRRGAAVYAPFSAERGDFVLLRSAQSGLVVLAAVRACRTDERGVTRLHLEFLDREWPLEGVMRSGPAFNIVPWPGRRQETIMTLFENVRPTTIFSYCRLDCPPSVYGFQDTIAVRFVELP